MGYFLLMLLAMMNTNKKDDNVQPSRLKVLQEDGLNTLHIGESFAVILEENPSTGYFWRYESTDPAAATLVSVTELNESPNSSFVGAPSQKMWRFLANKHGRFGLLFRLQRPGQKPVDSKSYDILVK